MSEQEFQTSNVILNVSKSIKYDNSKILNCCTVAYNLYYQKVEKKKHTV